MVFSSRPAVSIASASQELVGLPTFLFTSHLPLERAATAWPRPFVLSRMEAVPREERCLDAGRATRFSGYILDGNRKRVSHALADRLLFSTSTRVREASTSVACWCQGTPPVGQLGGSRYAPERRAAGLS